MKTTLRIRGRAYTVRGDEADGDLTEVAVEVERRMAEVQRGARGLDEYTAALLAALNLAAENRRLRRELDGALREAERELASLSVVLRAALPPDGADDAPGGA